MSNIPSIGRIVHYRPLGQLRAMAAIITAVRHDVDTVTVDLTYFPPGGPPLFVTNVEEYRAGDPGGLPERHWVWPPRVGLRPG